MLLLEIINAWERACSVGARWARARAVHTAAYSPYTEHTRGVAGTRRRSPLAAARRIPPPAHRCRAHPRRATITKPYPLCEFGEALRSKVVTDVKRVIKRRRNLVVISERVPSAGGSRPRRRRLARGSADLDSSGRGLLLVDSCPALGSPGARALGLGCVGAPQPRSSPVLGVLPVLLHGTSRLRPRAVQAPGRRAPSIPRRPERRSVCDITGVISTFGLSES